MRTDHSKTNEQSGYEQRSDGGEENHYYGGHHQDPQDLAVREGAACEDDRLIRGAEQVKEDPRGEEGEQDEKRERVGEKREGEGEGEEGEVVDAEVGEVLADTGGGLGEVFGAGESGAVDEL
ncbi:dihydrolipoamide acetyltransferase [Striga asiatica]|uniref:Dihydrolipoamide acetyltransferase n=1 Tax=Striga asiatica TaxID=4170 RepID=A0A5A7RKP0_STRAF|nr:dihydrolipoamide acetyltransferase [Striga asiatica]